MNNHTPGPWRIGRMNPTIVVADNHPKGKKDVAKCALFPLAKIAEFKDEDLANAQLISAAPELLEVCKALVFDNFTRKPTAEEVKAMFELARDAIAKAEGRG